MDIKSCRSCGKIFQYRGSYLCPDCVREMDEKFINVRNYMYENPHATITEICETVDVDEDMILSWLREGRLIATEGASASLKCAICNKPITGGRMCANCTNKMREQIQASTKDATKVIEKKPLDRGSSHSGSAHSRKN